MTWNFGNIIFFSLSLRHGYGLFPWFSPLLLHSCFSFIDSVVFPSLLLGCNPKTSSNWAFSFRRGTMISFKFFFSQVFTYPKEERITEHYKAAIFFAPQWHSFNTILTVNSEQIYIFWYKNIWEETFIPHSNAKE